jgi:hypothetical protein
MMLQSVVFNLPTQDATFSPVAGNLTRQTPAAEDSLVTRLLAHAEAALDSDGATLKADFDKVVTGGASTADAVRLQADMSLFSVRQLLIHRLAEDFSHGIQSITQRS